jgi:biopolymer transport protein ExbD
MTPLIDIVFLLIVFFMLVAQISKYRNDPIVLPMVDGAPRVTAENPNRIIIDVLASGGYRITGASVSPSVLTTDELPESLAAARAGSGNASAEVRAPRTAPYQRVSPVLRALQDAGFDGAEFAVQGPQQAGDP